jgi:hypothetical protein
MELLSANSATIQSILQDERGRLEPIKIRMGIYATIRRIINYQEGLFDSRNFGEDENYDYRYHIISKPAICQSFQQQTSMILLTLD